MGIASVKAGKENVCNEQVKSVSSLDSQQT